jgi:hypothetical protein
MDAFIGESNLAYRGLNKTLKLFSRFLRAHIKEDYFTGAETHAKYETIRVKLNCGDWAACFDQHEELLFLDIVQ